MVLCDCYAHLSPYGGTSAPAVRCKQRAVMVFEDGRPVCTNCWNHCRREASAGYPKQTAEQLTLICGHRRRIVNNYHRVGSEVICFSCINPPAKKQIIIRIDPLDIRELL